MLTLIKQWLSSRGLEISSEKTRVVHIDDGFNFLGFNLRQYKGKLLIKPQKEKVLAFCKKIKATLSNMRTRTQEDVIKEQITGRNIGRKVANMKPSPDSKIGDVLYVATAYTTEN